MAAALPPPPPRSLALTLAALSILLLPQPPPPWSSSTRPPFPPSASPRPPPCFYSSARCAGWRPGRSGGGQAGRERRARTRACCQFLRLNPPPPSPFLLPLGRPRTALLAPHPGVGPRQRALRRDGVDLLRRPGLPGRAHGDGAEEFDQPLHHRGRLLAVWADVRPPGVGHARPDGRVRPVRRRHRPGLQRARVRVAAGQLRGDGRVLARPAPGHGPGGGPDGGAQGERREREREGERVQARVVAGGPRSCLSLFSRPALPLSLSLSLHSLRP